MNDRSMWNAQQVAALEALTIASLPAGSDLLADRRARTVQDTIYQSLRSGEDAAVLRTYQGTSKSPEEARDLLREARRVLATHAQMLQGAKGRLALRKEREILTWRRQRRVKDEVVAAFTISGDTSQLLYLPAHALTLLRRDEVPWTDRLVHLGTPRRGELEDGTLETFMALYQPHVTGLLRDPRKALRAARDIHH